jgi:hypothetical protein
MLYFVQDAFGQQSIYTEEVPMAKAKAAKDTKGGIKTLTLDDVLGDQIDERTYDAEATKSPGGGQTRYRIRPGQYIMQIIDTHIRESNAGRRFLALYGKLYNEEEKFRGMVFPSVSWQYEERPQGGLDLKSRLFAQLVSALGAPKGTDLADFLAGVKDEFVRVEVSEYFQVKNEDINTEHVNEATAARIAEGNPEYTTFVFTNGKDEIANYYLDMEYESKGMVLEISALETTLV